MSDDFSHQERAPSSGPSLAVLLGLVVVICLAGYLALRVPGIREFLVTLVKHRPPIEMSMQRRLLAPRSLFLAGAAAGGVLVLALALRRGRPAMCSVVPRGQRMTVLFVALQAAVGIAVVVNLQAYFLRIYQRPLWRIPQDEVLARALPHIWREAQALKITFPDGARLALRVPADGVSQASGDTFMLHALAYPIALFDLSPVTEDWRDDTRFIDAARRYQLQYILDFRQGNRDHSLGLEPFKWELSGWRR